MTIKVKLQIVRKGTKYESFRVTIPKVIIDEYDFKDKDFKLEVKKNNIILTPLGFSPDPKSKN